MRVINCDYCQKRIYMGDPVFITNTFLTNESPAKLQGLQGVDIVYYGNLSKVVLCWNWNCILKLIYDLSPTSRTNNWFISFPNTESRMISVGGFKSYGFEWILVEEAKKMASIMIKIQSRIIIYRFVYQWLTTKLYKIRRKKWLLHWALSPFGWETQDMLAKYTRFTKTKIIKLKRSVSCPNLGPKYVQSYSDINKCRSIVI